ncbi:MAG: GNAT family N-acetyltransferase [Candidatus Levybacteria bacterium]|nr:GNAT family N-acetyltransferase [Candidatus Levybacteria bacterium]
MTIRSFKKEDQPYAQEIILNGLKEYWGFIDNTLNPDVYAIEKTYVQEGCRFLVAEADGRIVGTGGLMRTKDANVAQIVRVSVHPDHRRQGVAKEIVTHLLDYAREMGYKKVLVETTKSWIAPRTLYNQLGFREIREDEADVYMMFEL